MRAQTGHADLATQIKQNLQRIDEVEHEIGEIRERAQQLVTRISVLEQRERQLDRIVITLQRCYGSCADILAELPTESGDIAFDHSVLSTVRAFSDVRRSNDALADDASLQAMLDSMRDGIDSIDISDLVSQWRAHRRQRDDAVGALEKAAREAAACTALRDSEAQLLREAVGLEGRLEGVATVIRVYEGIKGVLLEQQQQHEQLAKFESGKFEAARRRLVDFIMLANSALPHLKRAARSDEQSNLRFHIDVELCSEPHVDTLIQKLMDDFKKRWEIRERVGEEAGEESNAVAREEELLRASIRDRCYENIFVNPRIRYESTLLRKSGKHLFDLSQLSGGQKTAVSLAWTARINEFLIRRTLDRAGSYAMRRKMRTYSSSFLIIDGLFSNLSDAALIEEALRDISYGRTDGRFQLIGFMHNPEYQNNFKLFPTFLLGRLMMLAPHVTGWLEMVPTDALGTLATAHINAVVKNSHEAPSVQ